MIYSLYAKKVEIYINTKKKTAAQVKAETGCDVVINGGLYDMSTFKPVLYLKKDDEYLSRVWNGDKPYGFGWRTSTADLVLDTNHEKYDNFISCTEICRDGKKVALDYDSRGGVRGRSAIGVTKEGKISIICTADGTSGAMTPEKLQTYALNHGWLDGIMLDSGGSCQCRTPAGNVSSSRRVHNFICIWKDESKDTKQVETCPYAEPKVNIRNGSRGTGAKWVQWMLNNKNKAGLIVDGIFGKNSVMALKAFQEKSKLYVDGICGSATRRKLKE